MSALVRLECDACGQSYEGGVSMTAAEVRTDAAEMDGWLSDSANDRDLCSECKAAASPQGGGAS